MSFTGGQNCCAFLPEGEQHELGLLFIYYLLKNRGVKALYVGSDTPLKDVEYVAKFKKPDLLYIHLTSVAPNFNFEKFISKITLNIPATRLIISGQLIQNYKKKLPHNVQLKRSLHEVVKFVSSIEA